MRLVFKVMPPASDRPEPLKGYHHCEQLEAEERDCCYSSHVFNLLVFFEVDRAKLSNRCDVNRKANNDLKDCKNLKDSNSFLFLLSVLIPPNNELVESYRICLENDHALK